MYKREMTTVAQCPKTIGSYIELVYAIFFEIHFLQKGCVGEPSNLDIPCTKYFGVMVICEKKW